MKITFNRNGFSVVEIRNQIDLYKYTYLIKDLSIETDRKIDIKKVTIDFDLST